MTSPALSGTPTASTFASATAHAVTAPASTASGNLLLLSFSFNASSSSAPTVTTPTGFSILSARTDNAGGNHAAAILYAKIADGTEGGTTFATTTSAGCEATAQVALITGNGTTLGTDVVAGTPANSGGSTNANPNPPSVSWAWGSRDALIVAITCFEDFGNTITGYPSSYSSGAAANGNGFTSAMAFRALTAAASPTDPGTFTISAATSHWITFTVAVNSGAVANTQSLGGTITPAGAITNKVAKPLGGTVTPAGALIKKIAKLLTGTETPAGAIANKVAKPIGGTITPAGSLATRVFLSVKQTLGGTFTPAAALANKVTRHLSLGGTFTPAGALIKRAAKMLGGLLGLSGTLSTDATYYAPPTWGLEIDRDGDGTFSDGDDFLPHARISSPPSVHRGRDGDRVLTPPYAGSLTALLDNRLNQAGTGAGVIKGRKVRLRELGTFDGTPRVLWQGILDQPQRQRTQADSVTAISALGELSRVAGRSCPATALYEGLRVDEALEIILDAIGHDAPRDFDEAETTLPYFYVGDSNGIPNAWDKMLETFNAEGPGAQLYEDTDDGTIVFRNRSALLTLARSTESQATISDAEQPSHSDLLFDDGLDNVINNAEITVNIREELAPGVVWTYGGGNIVVAAGQSTIISAVFDNGMIVKDAIAPSAGTDYTVVAGGGTVTIPIRTSGGIVPIRIAAGGGGLTISGLQLRATGIPVVSQQTVQTTDPPSSGVVTYSSAITPELDLGYAQSLADAIPAWWGNGRASVRNLEMRGDTTAKLVIQMTSKIGDRITIWDSLNGITGVDFWIMDIQHVLDASGKLLRTWFYAEAADNTDYALWDDTDVALWDSGIWGF